jgi:drug/metabolite transporter (DMT)-like permease
MLTGCAAFTAMNTLVKELSDDCDWPVIALFRTGLAFLFAAALALAGGAQLVILRPRFLWTRSLAGSISLLCCFFAITRTGPVSNILAITNIFPIWVALLAWPMLGIKPGWSILISVATAVAGVLLIRAPAGTEGAALLDFHDETTQATLFALLASVSTAVAMLGLNRLHWIDTRAVVAHFSGVSFVACAAALVVAEPRRGPGGLAVPGTLAMLVAVGVVATVGQICLTKAFTIGNPAKVSVVGLTQIVLTLLVDVCLFGERFTPLNLLGIALVMLPTAWVMLSHRVRPQPAVEVTVVEMEEEALSVK